jgi:hypothetical protein
VPNVEEDKGLKILDLVVLSIMDLGMLRTYVGRRGIQKGLYLLQINQRC